MKRPVHLGRCVAAVLALLGAGCTPTCEQAVAQANHALAATRCEQAYLKSKTPGHALATVRALELLGRGADARTRVTWLLGTPYEAVTQYYAGLAARGRDDAEARAALRQCLTGSLAAGVHDFAARCARQLASLQWTEGKFHEAFETLAVATAEVRLSQDPILEGKVYGQLADLLGEVGDVAGEGRALALVAARFKSAWPGGYAQVRLRQGLMELDRGAPQVARDAFDEALALAADAGLQPVVRAAHVNLANLDRAAGRWDAGEQHLAAAAAIPASRGYEDTTLWFAQAQLQASRGDWARAHATVSHALDAGAVPDWQWQLKSLEGECLANLGSPASARTAWLEAAGTIESLRQGLGVAALRPGLLAERRRPYEALFELHVQRAELEPAIELLEQLLARSFLETMASAAPSPADPDEAAQQAVRRLGTLSALSAYQAARAPTPIRDVLQRLGNREVLAFLAARGHLYRVHLRAGKASAERLEPIASLRRKLQRLDERPEDAEAAEAVGAALWPKAPVGAEVLIIPDATIAAVSFAGLKVAGRFLVEDHVLRYSPGLTIAAATPLPAQTGAAMLGDPRGTLPGAALEAKQTAKLLGGALSLGGQATRARLLEGCKGGFLHVATHSGAGPDGPWLELADGTITAAQLLEQRCAPTVVYLASCASAATARKDFSGTLASAFLAAGSQHVIATTRSIDDVTAARFSRLLFASPRLDQLPLRLATAQRAMLRDSPRAAWESFIILGR